MTLLNPARVQNHQKHPGPQYSVVCELGVIIEGDPSVCSIFILKKNSFDLIKEKPSIVKFTVVMHKVNATSDL